MLTTMKKFPMTTIAFSLLMSAGISLLFSTMWPFLFVVLIVLLTLV